MKTNCHMYYKIQLKSWPKSVGAYYYVQWAFINLQVFARKVNDKFIIAREEVLDALRKKGESSKEVADSYFCNQSGCKEFIMDEDQCIELE